jgi:hypothetical protein
MARRPILKPDLECAPCIQKWVYERAGILATEGERFQLVKRISEILAREFHPETNVGSLSNRITDSIRDTLSRSADYYGGIKLKSNQLARKLLPSARKYIEKGRTPRERFKKACRLASASNVAPMSVPGEAFKFQEVIHILKGKNPFPSVRDDVFEAAQQATRILYITDNAGEIGFDYLLISRLKEMGSKVTLVVKEEPFFEDATLKDVSFFGLDRLVDKISTVNGFFVPGEVSPSLMDLFKKSDLLIAKGTGNFEALKGKAKGKPTIYMLKIKCKPIALSTGIDMGNFVVRLET